MLTNKYLYCTFLLIILSCASPSKDESLKDISKYFPEKNWQGNVLIVSFDALRADSLGTYGYDRNTSPNIDRFSQNSLVFEDARSAGGSTPTSFAAAFSGRWPFKVFRKYLMVEKLTIAKIFQEAGYRTGFVSDNVQLVGKKGFSAGFEEFLITESNNDEKVLNSSLEMLERFGKHRFFLWVHFLSPHTPYDLRPGAEHLVGLDYVGPYEKSSGREFSMEDDEIDRHRLRELYDAEVFYADTLFEDILIACRKYGLDKNTLIVLTSDHGEEFGEHGGLRHDALFEEGVRIPFILHRPDALLSGKTSVSYSNVDLLPTLAGMAGLKYPPGLDGLDLNKYGKQRRALLSVYMTGKEKNKLSVKQDFMKLITYCEPEMEQFLFDLEKDPGERINIAKEDQKNLSLLNKSLRTLVKGDPCATLSAIKEGSSVRDGMDSGQINRLKSLGYVQ